MQLPEGGRLDGHCRERDWTDLSLPASIYPTHSLTCALKVGSTNKPRSHARARGHLALLPLSKSGYLSVLATVENSCDYTAIYNVEVWERGRSQKQSYFQLPATTGKNTPQSTLISFIPKKLYSLHYSTHRFYRFMYHKSRLL